MMTEPSQAHLTTVTMVTLVTVVTLTITMTTVTLLIMVKTLCHHARTAPVITLINRLRLSPTSDAFFHLTLLTHREILGREGALYHLTLMWSRRSGALYHLMLVIGTLLAHRDQRGILVMDIGHQEGHLKEGGVPEICLTYHSPQRRKHTAMRYVQI